MSSETLITWTCDRCQSPASVAGGTTPDGWVRLKMSSLWDAVRRSAGAAVDGRPTSLDICRRCIDAVILPPMRSGFLDDAYAALERREIEYTATPELANDVELCQALIEGARVSVHEVLAIEVAWEAQS